MARTIETVESQMRDLATESMSEQNQAGDLEADVNMIRWRNNNNENSKCGNCCLTHNGRECPAKHKNATRVES